MEEVLLRDFLGYLIFGLIGVQVNCRKFSPNGGCSLRDLFELFCGIGLTHVVFQQRRYLYLGLVKG